MLDDLRDAAANALPPPREDEPATLRQEILDELSDHFACAYRREILRTQGDAELSKRNVRERFGDPARIARKLWFDAMKGKLMAQKLMVLATCFSALLMALVAFAGWRLVEASQQATSALIARSQETSAALLAQSEKTHAAILARLDARNGEADWNDSLEWSNFELKFVEEGTGEPVTDVTVGINGPIHSVEQRSDYEQNLNMLRPDKNGVINISPAHIGRYGISITTAAGESFGESVLIRPGHDFQKTYRVPTKPETGKVDLQIEWPDRLRGRDLWCVIGVLQDSTRIVDELSWGNAYPRFFAVHTDGRIVDLAEVYGSYAGRNDMWGIDELTLLRDSVVIARANMRPGLGDVREGRLAPFLLGIYPHSVLPQEPEQLFAEITALGFGAPPGPDSGHDGLIGISQVFSTPFSSLLDMRDLVGPAAPAGVKLRAGSPGWFTVEADMTNRWTITIPDTLASSIPEEKLPPRTPVEAPKVSHSDRPYPTPAERNLWPGAQLIIECVTDSDGRPLEGVRLQLGRDDISDDPFALKSAMDRSDENGRVDFGVVPPGRYDLWAFLPNENGLPPNEHLHRMKQFTIHGPDPVTKTITCPSAPPPRTIAEYKIHWPDPLPRDDIWLVLEMTGVRERRTRDSQWIISDWHLAAFHPDGRTIVWTKPTDEYYSLHSLEKLPPDQRLSDLVANLSSNSSDTPISPSLLANARFQISGIGIARWDGSGSSDELLAGIRDGRYISDTRGAFFYVLREIAPMKAVEELPELTMTQSPEDHPMLEYTVPESLLQSALRRWNELPIAGK